MAQLYQARPSRIAGIDDPYEAWCLDEVITEYIVRIQKGQKPRPKKTDNNDALIKKLKGGG